MNLPTPRPNSHPDKLPNRPPVASPCVNICRMDTVSGWCEGCLRSLDEIATWGAASDVQRSAVLALLPARRLQRRQQLALRRAQGQAAASAALPDAAALAADAPEPGLPQAHAVGKAG